MAHDVRVAAAHAGVAVLLRQRPRIVVFRAATASVQNLDDLDPVHGSALHAVGAHPDRGTPGMAGYRDRAAALCLAHNHRQGQIDLSLAMVVREAERCGAIAVPCHPGRATVGMCAHCVERGPVDGVKIIEVLNGGSRGTEDDDAWALAEKHGYAGVGGSDAHIVSHIGRCATRFSREIRNEEDLVAALYEGGVEAVSWK